MPTENRSSNTEMVSDSEMTECQFHNNCGGWCETHRELEHNLCEHCLESHDEEMAEPAPAPQSQPKPTTPYGWHVEWADSGDHYLFTKVEKRIEALRLDSDVKVVQLYTHADPGEVVHLFAANTEYARRHLEMQGEVERLRAQMTERDALLREALEFIDDGVGRSDAEWRLIKKLRTALSPDGAASTTDEPYQGIPGTSFQRLNALANQGE